MKKNVVPLVIIALVVAVAATGIFYGLIVSRMDAHAAAPSLRPVASAALEKGKKIEAPDFRMAEASSAEPGPLKPEDLIGRVLLDRVESGAVLTDRVLGKLRRQSLTNGIPSGMRAVTMHVSDSSSVLELLEAGDRVDVQSVSSRPSYSGPVDFVAKTILENVIVYGLGGMANGPGGPRGVLTVLVSPSDAERLAQADAGTRLRISLRNRHDDAVSKPAPPPSPLPVVTSSFRAKASVETLPREYDLHLIEVDAAELSNTSANWTQKFEEWKAAHKASLWASSTLDVTRGGEVTWRGANPEAAVRVRLDDQTAIGGAKDAAKDTIGLRISSEALRRADKQVRLSPTESALVSGLVPRDQYAVWREKFAPGRAPQSPNAELVVVVTPAARR